MTDSVTKGGPLRIALASCDPYPPVADDEVLLRQALRARGADVEDPAWDAPIDWSRFDAVLIRTTWNYHERKEAFVAWSEATSAVTRLFHGPEVIRWNSDKRYLAALEARGVRLAETAWLAIGMPLAEAAREIRTRAERWTRGFLKPVVGANAWRTLAFDAGEAGLGQALAFLQAEATDANGRLTAGFMLQPYLASVESEGERSLIWIDGAPAHAIAKVPAPGDYRVQEDWGAKDFRIEAEPELRELATRAIDAAEAIVRQRLLYARIDTLRDAAGRLVLNELELVEPALFFRHAPETAERLAAALLARLATPA